MPKRKNYWCITPKSGDWRSFFTISGTSCAILQQSFSSAYTSEQLAEAVYAMVLNSISDPISLDNPKVDLTGAGVQAAMDTLIAKNIFITSGGDLVSKVKATIVDTTDTVLFGD